MAAWHVRPRLVTMAAAVFITGSQSGVVVSATSTSPGRKDESWWASVTTRTRPVAMRAPTARPDARTLPFPSNAKVSISITLPREATVSGRA